MTFGNVVRLAWIRIGLKVVGGLLRLFHTRTFYVETFFLGGGEGAVLLYRLPINFNAWLT